MHDSAYLSTWTHTHKLTTAVSKTGIYAHHKTGGIPTTVFSSEFISIPIEQFHGELLQTLLSPSLSIDVTVLFSHAGGILISGHRGGHT